MATNEYKFSPRKLVLMKRQKIVRTIKQSQCVARVPERSVLHKSGEVSEAGAASRVVVVCIEAITPSARYPPESQIC